jgi:pimeloyl-ACP methyl ester carboxylesterase
MPQAAANGIQIHYESFGPSAAPAVLLVMGLGCQMIRWNKEICDGLVDEGFRVIRFDHRDCGRSTRCEDVPVPDFRGFMQTGRFSALPYTLETMADDCIGLLDAIGIANAHIAGASMGGAIAQIVAARHPERTLSLTSIMSSSGNPMLPPPTPAAMMSLVAPLPLTRDRATIVADAIQRFRAVASPAYPTPDAELEALFGAEYDRGFYPPGVARQLAALMADGDRRPLLQAIRCPTVVLHGADDPLIPCACGEDVALNVPGAKMIRVPGLGHDFPKALTKTFVGAICSAAR